MSNIVLAAMNGHAAATVTYTVADAILFYCAAAFMVVCALMVALSKQATHSAIAMVGVMLGLSVIYFSQGAIFLSVVQVVVYTGAIMILFLFVLMLVGVAASDNYQKTSPWLRAGAWVLGIAGAAMLGATFWMSHVADMPNLTYQNDITNPVAIALSIFGNHMFTMELTGALLILAAIGAVTLTHSDPMTKVMKQPETAEARLKAYAESGVHPGQLPAPGVYAGHNAPDAPAITGIDMAPLEASVPRVIRAQNNQRPLGYVAPKMVERIKNQKNGDLENGLHSFEANRATKRSGAWGMPGEAAEMGLMQPETKDVRPGALTAAGETPKVQAATSKPSSEINENSEQTQPTEQEKEADK